MDYSKEYMAMCIKAYPDISLHYHVYLSRRRWTLYTDGEDCHRWDDAVNTTNFDKWFPLYGQDQLQEIVFEGEIFGSHVPAAMFKQLSDYLHLMKNPDCEYWHEFASMEQLWLGYVMKTKYQKTWNGTEWR